LTRKEYDTRVLDILQEIISGLMWPQNEHAAIKLDELLKQLQAEGIDLA